ncbi:MAG: peptide chain release factor N(5)-glutamine methyltransferase [Acetobacteraceae bacterium]|nr:peptide chain release factor N(5)-glutamine methyltransferase [Acetobacteraceae bacterium]
MGFFLCQAGQRLRGAAIEAPRLEARRLLAHVLGTTEEALLRDPRAAVPADKAAHFAALLARRVAREPFAYLTGRVGFWTLELEVSPATLIPRADSETLVEAALAACPDKGAARRVLDLGTGTGALLLAVLSEFPAASGVGIDIKPAAVALAERNAVRLGLADRAGFLAGDWAAAVLSPFDLILCNPPYIESAAIAGLMPEVARHEPASALDGGADGLSAYRRIIADLPRLLAPRGLAVLELGQGQQAAVEALGKAAGFRPEACSADLGGVPRALVLRAA